MNGRNFALGILGAIAIAAAGYFAGTAISGRTIDVASAETAGAPAPAAGEGAATVAAVSEGERKEIEVIIRNYLLEHPEIVRDAINELQRREDAAEQAEQVKAIGESKDLLFASSRQVVLGNPTGDVTLVEFFDYNCGYCKRAHADMKKLISEDKNLRYVLKEFPVLGDGSVEAAQVSIAVQMIAPDKAAAFHDALLLSKGGANGEHALAVAEELGLDRAKLTETMKSDAVRETITEVYAMASKLNLTGTPSYVTASEVVVGAVGYDALKEKIAAARAACANATC